MLLLLTILFAIPTYGLSVAIYIAWLLYVNYFGQQRLKNLSNLEKAVLYLGKAHNGSLIGSSFDELSWSDMMHELLAKSVRLKSPEANRKYTEFQIAVGGKKFDVLASRTPDIKNGVILCARKSERWLDELTEWMDAHMAGPSGVSKFFLPHQTAVVFGAAHNPEWRATKPNVPPDVIGNLTNLKTLALIYREISTLPNSISRLTQLEELKLGGNTFVNLPVVVCKLNNLKVLTLWSNKLRRLPAEIGNLQRLEVGPKLE